MFLTISICSNLSPPRPRSTGLAWRRGYGSAPSWLARAPRFCSLQGGVPTEVIPTPVPAEGEEGSRTKGVRLLCAPRASPGPAAHSAVRVARLALWALGLRPLRRGAGARVSLGWAERPGRGLPGEAAPPERSAGKRRVMNEPQG